MTAMRDATQFTAAAETTIALLWASVRQRGELPGFAKVMGTILGAMRGDDDAAFDMPQTVLSDPALTFKALRLANSPMYAAFGQDIQTLSRAVQVLGTESIGHLALGLKLIDGPSIAPDDAPRIRAEMETTVLAGQIGRQTALAAGLVDAEAAVVCAMLHCLGRMMVAFYLPQHWQMVRAEAAADCATEQDTACRILGLGLDQIGILVARQWGLPAGLVDTMVHVIPNQADQPLALLQRMALLAAMSLQCADAFAREGSDSVALTQKISAIVQPYAAVLHLEPALLNTAVQCALPGVGVDLATDTAAPTLLTGRISAAEIAYQPRDCASVLRSGLDTMQTIADSGRGGFPIQVALDAIFKGLGLSHAIAFQRQVREARYCACLSLGDGVAQKLPAMAFGDAYHPDVCHAALVNDKMVFVENTHDRAIAGKLPNWWAQALPTTRSFVLLPLIVHRVPVGFLYGGWDHTVAPAKLDAADVLALNAIRALLTRLIEQAGAAEIQWNNLS